ncbi:MAG: RNA-binding protein [Candidatus Aenigmarchaeota archaeon]|nr:RNA-binding protein [Candidatus Aenigmarchaeota archaeon]
MEKTEDTLLLQDKSIVIPGEVIATGMGYIPGTGTYREGDKLNAARLGLLTIDGKVVKLLPVSGKYLPKLNDRVIGKVIDVLLNGWRIEINCPYSAVLTLKDATSEFIARGADLTQYFALGDWIVAKIVNVTSQKLIDVSMKGPGLRKLQGGQIIAVNPQKVPRIIGKEGSMVTLIKEATGCNIIVGQNGLVWIEGDPKAQLRVIETITKIEVESHLTGLTERISTFLKGKGA